MRTARALLLAETTLFVEMRSLLFVKATDMRSPSFRQRSNTASSESPMTTWLKSSTC